MYGHWPCSHYNNYYTIILCDDTHSTFIYVSYVLDTVIVKVAQMHGWNKSGSHWSIKNQEEFIKPKKIISKIEFDSKSILYK